jgi:alanyl-tRNA synthetase
MLRGEELSALTADKLRTMYISYFAERGHAVIPSASLVPSDDPSVLFTTAGMHPLVPYLLGRPHPSGDMLVNYQKCVRTNDIEEVGDATHLTFFEMLGNWSLGTYFKQESITWSYEFLTGTEYLNIPSDQLWVTVFEGNQDAPRDEEAAAIWRSLGIDQSRIVYLGAEHNWWAVGPEGPCGPDTEIFVDPRGEPCPDEDPERECLPGLCQHERFFEIWNNVFMTFERRGGELRELPKRNVDTGMGLERTLAVLNRLDSVYETHPLVEIKQGLAQLLTSAGSTLPPERVERTLRILTDHLRTSVFMLGDQNPVEPSNQGRGYVLRRLIRRAARVCHRAGFDPSAWADASKEIVRLYGSAYPELERRSADIAEQLAAELNRFQKTLERGTAHIQRELRRLRDSDQKVLAGDVAFQLYETYGFPVELTQELAGEEGVQVDLEGYRRREEQHREASKSAMQAAGGLMDDSDESVRYHTATHLLHTALRKVLGDHVFQRGSNITKERLRFDFSHPAPLTKDQVAAVEALVQEWIDADIPVEHEVLPQDEARRQGAIGLFDEHYSGLVSIYRIGDKSLEFCGGPHVINTRELGRFKIVKEQSVGAGLRRIRAVLTPA